jgi:nitrogen fixation protein FixH
MKAKNFHWGHGIFVFYVIFVGVLVTALVASFGVDHTLVVDDYYAKDLAYQDQYDKESRSRTADNLNVTHTAGEDEVILHFDTDALVTGNIEWYRPSGSEHDFDMPISKSEMLIETGDLLPGRWRLKVDWQEAGKTYYREVDLYL